MEKLTRNQYIIIMAALSSFTVAFTSNAVSIALPSIAYDFHISNILQNWIVTIFLLTIAATSVPLGKICIKYGLNNSVKKGLIIYILGSFLSGISIDITTLLISRTIQAIGASILFITGMAIITSEIPPSKRGQAIGFNISAVYIGLTLAPTLAGILTYNISWRTIFYITIPIGIIAYYISTKISKEWITPKQTINKTSAILYMIGIILFIYGFSIINTISGILITILGLVILIIFAYHELKNKEPIYDMKLFKNIKYTSANLASLISYFATFVVTYILNYHFQYLEGLNSQTTGIILIITPILMAIMAPLSGKLSDKIEPQILAATGMLIATIGIGLLCFLDNNTPIIIVILSMILFGIGFGLFSSPNNNVIMGSVPKKDTATASASLSTVRTIGQTLSLGMLTVIFAYIMGNVEITPQVYSLLTRSLQITAIICTILCMMAVLLSLLGIKNKKNHMTKKIIINFLSFFIKYN
ncbi:MAG: MFS transporter [Methanobacteriaceae archaeon]|nr:MFS transporter [Methanobacteriaceae archaeon]